MQPNPICRNMIFEYRLTMPYKTTTVNVSQKCNVVPQTFRDFKKRGWKFTSQIEWNLASPVCENPNIIVTLAHHCTLISTQTLRSWQPLQIQQTVEWVWFTAAFYHHRRSRYCAFAPPQFPFFGEDRTPIKPFLQKEGDGVGDQIKPPRPITNGLPSSY